MDHWTFKLFFKVMRVWDILLLPFVIPAAIVMKITRYSGNRAIPLTTRVLKAIGVFPIVNHYYEPQFKADESRRPFAQDRHLPGITWNEPEQLSILAAMNCAAEVKAFPPTKPKGYQRDDPSYYINNMFFESGDGEYWYQFLRLKKPRRVIEVGSGFSTLVAVNALTRNKQDDPSYQCEHICIEPYERPWLEKKNLKVVRKRIEDLELSFFQDLGEGDILFIDSSHVIRPDGDVLFEYLELLPTLRPGVIVHVHDIFTPHNYLREWLVDDVRLWNEQYLLEAFLTDNPRWKIIGALNLLSVRHFDALKAVAPSLKPDTHPRSFYMQKIA